MNRKMTSLPNEKHLNKFDQLYCSQKVKGHLLMRLPRKNTISFKFQNKTLKALVFHLPDSEEKIELFQLTLALRFLEKAYPLF